MTIRNPATRGGPVAHSSRPSLKPLSALLFAVLSVLPSLPAIAAPPRYFNNFEEAYAACRADEWGTACHYRNIRPKR